MTENQKEVLKYKDYPEGSGSKRLYDTYFLSFEDYLAKYYSNPNWDKWSRFLNKYIEPAFDINRHDEMIKNFGYLDKKFYDFSIQYEVYNEIKDDDRLSDDVKKFIGFLAGVGFFKKYNITLKQWFDIINWANPHVENEEGKTINEILSFIYGINYFKKTLTELNWWNRDLTF